MKELLTSYAQSQQLTVQSPLAFIPSVHAQQRSAQALLR
jgi:hypothetical protein